MARTTSHTLLLLIATAFLLGTTTAQSPAQAPMFVFGPEAAPGPGEYSPLAPSPGPDCFSALLTAADCLTFVDPTSNLTTPDAGCCDEIANLINTQPICLCTLVGDPSSTGLNIDTKRALRLPTVCNVTTPPLSLCALIGVPVGVPTPSVAPTAGNGDGSIAASPSPGSSENANPATSLASNQHLLVGLAALLFAYLF